MATLTEYFETESRELLTQLERALLGTPQPDAAEIQRAARGLRGTAQMAREERVFRAVSAFEAAARALAANALAWSDSVAGHARDTVEDLRALTTRSEPDEQLDGRMHATIARWREAGVDLPAPANEVERTASDGSGSREFREFAAREVAGIADALDTGVQQLAAAPMDREPLKMILRRQRALLGAARLDEVPVVAEILRAVEDLTRVIAKLDVGVKQEWLDIYRVAREGLKGTIDALERDQDPQPSHPLSRLRHMREELLERYGAGEAVSTAHQSSEGLVQATQLDRPPEPVPAPPDTPPDTAPDTAPDTMEPPVEDLLLDTLAADDAGDEPAELMLESDDVVTHSASDTAPRGTADTASGAAQDDAGQDVVDIEELCYRGDAALERALELRAPIAAATAQDPQARAAVDELFDLVRLARE